MRTVERIAVACVAAALIAASGARAAEDYPSRTVTIIVPFAPGGSTDLLGRYEASVLQQKLGGTFIVENRPGAGGITGITAAARTAPDGYTLLHAPTAFGLIPHLQKSVPYDTLHDFAPIVLVGATNFGLVVGPRSPVRSVADLIALARQKPGELTYASAGVGTTQHLFAELFKSMAGVDIRHIPYKGTAPGLVDVMSGDVTMMFTDLGPALPMVRDGKLALIAVTTLRRSPDMPDVPTVAETLPGYEAVGWQGLLARAGTPDDILDRLNAALVPDLRSSATAGRFKAFGIDVRSSSRDEFRRWIQSEYDKWGKVIRAAGIATN
jgi:tripartite-type tricarboxylate transporter receptor subunit TctC